MKTLQYKRPRKRSYVEVTRLTRKILSKKEMTADELWSILQCYCIDIGITNYIFMGCLSSSWSHKLVLKRNSGLFYIR